MLKKDGDIIESRERATSSPYASPTPGSTKVTISIFIIITIMILIIMNLIVTRNYDYHDENGGDMRMQS